jgi:hypothetical protein
MRRPYKVETPAGNGGGLFLERCNRDSGRPDRSQYFDLMKKFGRSGVQNDNKKQDTPLTSPRKRREIFTLSFDAAERAQARDRTSKTGGFGDTHDFIHIFIDTRLLFGECVLTASLYDDPMIG